MRIATVERKTKETQIKGRVDLDGTGAAEIATGIGFLDHMLEQLAKHGLIDIALHAKGDLQERVLPAFSPPQIVCNKPRGWKFSGATT